MPFEKKTPTPSALPSLPKPTEKPLTKAEVLQLAREVAQWQAEFPTPQGPAPKTESDEILSRLD
jgi:hypothetical protein